tara:strand:- start:1 stop:1713 length:1713 start_codon:yes stop_codon:yes gene_type:complete
LFASNVRAASPYEASLKENILEIPYIRVGEKAFGAAFTLIDNNCPTICFELQTAEDTELDTSAINVPFYDGSIIRLPRLRVNDDLYSADFSGIDGKTIFLSNYQTLTEAKAFPHPASIVSRHRHGEKFGFEGVMIETLQGGVSPLLVKSFFSMHYCTDEDTTACYERPPLFLYEWDSRNAQFADVSNRITNPDQFVIPLTYSYFVADINGDGKEDLVAGTHGEFFSPPGERYNGWNWENYILLSNTDSSYTWKILHEFKGNTRHLSGGDIDNDGDLDLYVGDAADPDRQEEWQNFPEGFGGYFLINDGDGNFTKGAQRFINTYSSELADLNNDGFVDLILASSGPYGCPGTRVDCRLFNGVYIYRNNGDKTFTEIASDLPFTEEHNLTQGEPWVVRLDGVEYETPGIGINNNAFDVNSDGLLDLLITYGSDTLENYFVSFLINQGDFKFKLNRNRIKHFHEDQIIVWAKVLDANQDGNLDIYFQRKYRSGDNPLDALINEAIYYNDGNGYFNNDNLMGLPSIHGGLTVFDIDQNGLNDFISTDNWAQHMFSESEMDKRTKILFQAPPKSN